jgi:predicted nucleic acid-binding protein
VITAVDTRVLLDVFAADPDFGETSRDALRVCLAQGSLVACDVVWAETAASFVDERRAASALDRLGVSFSPLDRTAAFAGARAWRSDRKAGGERTRVIADVLIAGHAMTHAD